MRINKVFLSGRLGKEPVLKQSNNNSSMLVMRIATNYGESTEWHTLLAFSKTAEYIAKYAKKGQEVCIEGRLSSKLYTDSSGKEREGTVIIVLNIELGKMPLKAQSGNLSEEPIETSMFVPA